MASKRDHSDYDEGEVTEPEVQHKKKKSYGSGPGGARQHQNSSIDPTSGQKYVFSSYEDATTIPAGEESDFEDDAEAMAYLMSVRKQASGIPQLLVAPKVQIGPQLPPDMVQDGDGDDVLDEDPDDYDEGIDGPNYTDGIGDARGYYEDGAYYSVPDPEEEGQEDEEHDEPGELTEGAIMDAYFASILKRFANLRRNLGAKPPADAHARLPHDTALVAAPFSRKSSTLSKWSGIVLETDPHPLQLALMSKDSVFRVLEVILRGKFLRQGRTISERTSYWLWALLARLPERGEMNHEEVGWVRDLGFRAVLLGRTLAEMAALRDELADGGLGMHENVDGSGSDEDVHDDATEGADSPMSGTDRPTSAPEESQNDIEAAESTESAANKTRAGDDDDDDDEQEEGEIAEDSHDEAQEDDEDVAMDIASNSSVVGDEAPPTQPEDLEAAKARLLSQVEEAEAEHNVAAAAAEEAAIRSRINMRATLSMILTVAGELYGQRDLLAFREPFVGI